MLPGGIYSLNQREKNYVEKEFFLDLKKVLLFIRTHTCTHICMCAYMHVSTGACGGQKTEVPGATGHGCWEIELGS